MRRMFTNKDVVLKPKVAYFEDELTNDSSVNVKLVEGLYLIELHSSNSTNSALIRINEDNICISTSTMFNAGVAGANIGYYHYDTKGQLLEIYDSTESNITVNGHIDIYKI